MNGGPGLECLRRIMTETEARATEPGAARRAGGDARPLPVTSGGSGGASGDGLPGRVGPYAAAAILIGLVNLANVLSLDHEAYDAGLKVEIWRLIVLEFSSGVAIMSVSPLIPWVMRRAGALRRRPLRFFAVHLLGSLTFSAGHIALALLLRVAAYAVAGHAYTNSLTTLPYEYSKDLIAYGGLTGIFWLFDHFSPARAEPVLASAAPSKPQTIDIREGGRLLRTPSAEILAVRAAGNYVEFILDGGRRPLMRATLAEIEAQLAGHGFVRTHRSWLVNLARVRLIEPIGSGDFSVQLDDGASAPVSRRYPQALASLRGSGPRG